MKDGRRFCRPPDPYTPPSAPQGRINITDPDSRVVKGLRGFIQGYNAGAVTNEHQIVVAAEVMTAAPGFGNLEAMLDATRRELDAVGIDDVAGVVLADAGCWHRHRMERAIAEGMQVLIRARRRQTQDASAGLDGRLLRVHAPRAGDGLRRRALPPSPADDRARLRAHQTQPRHGPLSPARPRRRQSRMAAHHGHPQPPQAPPPHLAPA